MWLAFLSAGLLIFSYPQPDWGWLAWVALVPLLVAVDGQPPRRAFAIAWLSGFLFFLGLLHWLIYVTIPGWIVLSAYLAIFIGIFGVFVAQTAQGGRQEAEGKRTTRLTPHASRLQPLFFIPAAWVSLEWLRNHLLTGFGWGLLGYTQWRWLPVIQVADVLGAYGISFLVVLVNAAFWLALREWRHPQHVRVVPLVVAAALLSTFGYGWWRLDTPLTGERLTVAVVQGNIPQSQKWDPGRKGPIMTTYARLTRQAAEQHPDLIVWPETAVPDFAGADEEVTLALLDAVRKAGVPCVVGAPTQGYHAGRLAAFNSALLVTPDGGFEERYNKLHLVPFGEFLPFQQYAPWLRELLPPMGDFAPGESATVFHLGSRLEAEGARQQTERRTPHASRLTPAFSTLICFEDVFPHLARRFVREGAGLLLVITNDAWFGPTGAAIQHAQASVFRAVENRVSVARAANTGLSCFIDPWGRLTGSVQDAAGRRLFVEGVSAREVLVTSARSPYRAVGDCFALLCVLLTIGWLGWAGRSALPARRQPR